MPIVPGARTIGWSVGVVIIVAAGSGCGETREMDASAYERPSGTVTDSFPTADSASTIRTDDAGDAASQDVSRADEQPPADVEPTPATGEAPAQGDSTGDDRPPVGADPSPSVDERPPQAADSMRGDAAPTSAQAIDVDRLLATADAAYAGLPSLRAAFHQVIDVPLLERRREGHGTWYQKGRGRFKMDFEDPPQDEIVADGTYLWLFYPSTNPRQVIRSRLGAPGTGSGTADVLARILEEARVNYEGQYAGNEIVDGVTTHLVSLRPTTRSQYRLVRVWIADRDHLVRKFEITEENETVRTVTLTDLEPGAALPDTLFRFIPPADADVFSGPETNGQG